MIEVKTYNANGIESGNYSFGHTAHNAAWDFYDGICATQPLTHRVEMWHDGDFLYGTTGREPMVYVVKIPCDHRFGCPWCLLCFLPAIGARRSDHQSVG